MKMKRESISLLYFYFIFLFWGLLLPRESYILIVGKPNPKTLIAQVKKKVERHRIKHTPNIERKTTYDRLVTGKWQSNFKSNILVPLNKEGIGKIIN